MLQHKNGATIVQSYTTSSGFTFRRKYDTILRPRVKLYELRSVINVATNSLYNNIKVKDVRFCKSLIKAMEVSEQNDGKKVVMSKRVENLDKEKIKAIFGEDSDRV